MGLLQRVKNFLIGPINLLLINDFIGSLFKFLCGGSVRYHGALIDTNSISPRSSVARIVFGYYERAEVTLVQRYFKGDFPIIELGSNCGVIASIILSQRRTRDLICVEPNPRLLPAIELNTARNRNKDQKVRILNFAVDYAIPACEKARFTIHKNSLMSSVERSECDRIIGEEVYVPASSLQSILERESVGDFALVMDIEGAEAALLFEDADALVNCRQLLAEFHPTIFEGKKIDEEALVVKTLEHGFDLVDSIGSVYFFERARGF